MNFRFQLDYVTFEDQIRSAEKCRSLITLRSDDILPVIRDPLGTGGYVPTVGTGGAEAGT